MKRTNAPIPGDRDLTYDWLRLIAISCAVIGHGSYLFITSTYGSIFYTLPENISPVYFSNILLKVCRTLSALVYSFHMPLFFMLSGAVLAIKELPSFDKLVSGKLSRLLVPYYIYGLLFMLPLKYIGGFYAKANLVPALNGFLFGMDDSGHLWFLPALFWCMVVFAIIIGALNRFSITGNYAMLFVCGIMQMTYTYLPFDVLHLKTGLGYIFWFGLGYLFEKERQTRGRWSLQKITGTCVGLLCIGYFAWEYELTSGFYLTIVFSFGAYLLARICQILFANFSTTLAWSILIRNLFAIYLFHDPLEYVVLRMFFEKNYLHYPLGCYLFYFCRFILIPVISLCLGEMIRYIKHKISGRRVN